MDSEILVPIAFFFSVVAIIKIISDNRVRQRIVERGQIDESIKQFFAHPQGESKQLTHLKWGMVLLAIGLALLIDAFLPELGEGAKWGIVFIFAGAAFLIYYQKARQFMVKENENETEDTSSSQKV